MLVLEESSPRLEAFKWFRSWINIFSSPMASPLSQRGEGGISDQPEENRPEQNPTDGQENVPPTQNRPTAEEMTAEIVRLRQEFANLQMQASSAVGELQQQVNIAQGSAQQARIEAHQPPLAPARVPQPQRFKGVREGPKILEWVHQATQYLRAAGLESHEQGIWHIMNFLEGDAATWWRLYCDKMDRGVVPKIVSWAELKQLLVEQFQVFNHITDIRDRFTSLRQTSTVSDYINKFRQLIVELPGEPEDLQIYQFLKGLKPEIQARTRTHKPTTLNIAMDIADEADRANYHAYRGSSRFSSNHFSRPNTSYRGSSTAQPMQIGAVSSLPPPIPPHEIERLRQQNRCFYCRKTGHAARDCRKKKSDGARAKAKKKTGIPTQPAASVRTSGRVPEN